MIDAISPRLRFFCLATALLLIGLPVAASALRASEFDASLEVFALRRPAELPARADSTSYVASLVRTKVFEREAVQRAGLDLDTDSLADRLTVERTERSALVTATGHTPDDALVLATALNGALASASRVLLRAQATAELKRVRQRLLSGDLDGAQRSALTLRAAALEALAANTPPEIAFGPTPSTVRMNRILDRAADALPGPFPPNFGPARVGLAGFVLAALACAIALLLSRRGASRPPRAEGSRIAADVAHVRRPEAVREVSPVRVARPAGVVHELGPVAVASPPQPARELGRVPQRPELSPSPCSSRSTALDVFPRTATATAKSHPAGGKAAGLAIAAVAGVVALRFWRRR